MPERVKHLPVLPHTRETARKTKPDTGEKKAPDEVRSFFLRCQVGWLMGLEPTTTRITIWDSTN
jgi:hypothetical protein